MPRRVAFEPIKDSIAASKLDVPFPSREKLASSRPLRPELAAAVRLISGCSLRIRD